MSVLNSKSNPKYTDTMIKLMEYVSNRNHKCNSQNPYDYKYLFKNLLSNPRKYGPYFYVKSIVYSNSITEINWQHRVVIRHE